MNKIKLIILALTLLFGTIESVSQIFQPMGYGFSQLTNTNDPFVYDVEIYKGDVFAVGEFSHADSLPAQNIAVWYGGAWHSIGTGLNNIAWCMAEYNGLLYIGGYFTDANGVAVKGLVSYDGNSFQATGFPPTWLTEVHDLKVHNGKLFVGSSAGVYSWDGTIWTFISDIDAHSLQHFNGELYMGEWDTLVKWDGTLFSILPAPDSYLWDMEVFDNSLFLGGWFEYLDTIEVDQLARYDGSTFSDVNGGINGNPASIYDLEPWKGRLFIGGEFSNIGGTSASNLAAWTGSAFEAYGSFPPAGSSGYSEIHSLKAVGTRLYVAGFFLEQTGSPGNCIAYMDWSIPAATFSGFVYFDKDSNCVYNDTIDNPLNDVLLKATPGPFYGYSGFDGTYRITLPPGPSYNVEAIPINGKDQHCPVALTHTVTNVTAGNTYSGLDFAFKENTTCPNLNLEMSTVLPFYICTGNVLYLTITNDGNGPAYNAYVEMQFPNVFQVFDSLVYYFEQTLVFNSDSMISLGNNKFRIDLNDFEANKTRWYGIPYQTSCDWAHHGINFDIVVEGFSSGTECDTTDNGSFSRGVLGSSLDPNDKLIKAQNVLKGMVSTDTIDNDDSIIYQIQFQNVGTLPAINVTIIDTLDKKLDFESFRLLVSSHPCQIELLEENIVQWTFENINLPDSASDEAGSKGLILFQMNQSIGNIPGTMIYNAASIYFDNNPAVNTNQVTNLIPLISGISTVYSVDELNIYPNPNHGMFSLKLDNFYPEVTTMIFDITGQLLFKQKDYQSKQLHYNFNAPSGIYIMKVNTGNKNYHQKIIIQ